MGYLSVEKAKFLSLRSSLYVEGVDKGTCQIKLTYQHSPGKEVWDIVKYTFIAADCGRQPKTKGTRNERQDEKGAHKNIVHCEWSIIVEPTSVYNCIAWSINITTDWIWNQVDEDYGDVDGIIEISDFDSFYDYYNYKPCTETEAEIMLYKKASHQAPDNPDGITHACRKRSCSCGAGKWIMFESKEGTDFQTEHRKDALNGGM